MGSQKLREVRRDVSRCNVAFMDYQKYAFQMSWDKQFVMWLMSRNGG